MSVSSAIKGYAYHFAGYKTEGSKAIARCVKRYTFLSADQPDMWNKLKQIVYRIKEFFASWFGVSDWQQARNGCLESRMLMLSKSQKTQILPDLKGVADNLLHTLIHANAGNNKDPNAENFLHKNMDVILRPIQENLKAKFHEDFATFETQVQSQVNTQEVLKSILQKTHPEMTPDSMKASLTHLKFHIIEGLWLLRTQEQENGKPTSYADFKLPPYATWCLAKEVTMPLLAIDKQKCVARAENLLRELVWKCLPKQELCARTLNECLEPAMYFVDPLVF